MLLFLLSIAIKQSEASREISVLYGYVIVCVKKRDRERERVRENVSDVSIDSNVSSANNVKNMYIFSSY